MVSNGPGHVDGSVSGVREGAMRAATTSPNRPALAAQGRRCTLPWGSSRHGVGTFSDTGSGRSAPWRARCGRRRVEAADGSKRDC